MDDALLFSSKNVTEYIYSTLMTHLRRICMKSGTFIYKLVKMSDKQ